MVTLTGYQMDSEFMPFDVFSYGRAAFIETEKVLPSAYFELDSCNFEYHFG
jgi:hypothetical protein